MGGEEERKAESIASFHFLPTLSLLYCRKNRCFFPSLSRVESPFLAGKFSRERKRKK